MTIQVSLTQELITHEPHDSARRKGYVALPIMCGGPRYFSYVERTYRNFLRINARIEGYKSPSTYWSVAGQAVTRQGNVIQTRADWAPQPPSNPLFPDFHFRPPTANVTATSLGQGMDATVGPHEGNTHFTVTLTVEESSGGPNANRKTVSMEVDLLNQEIVWEKAYYDAVRRCDHLEHLANGVKVVIGPPQPGDPQDLIGTISHALEEKGSNRVASLKNAAHLLKSSRPEVAHALTSLAERASEADRPESRFGGRKMALSA